MPTHFILVYEAIQQSGFEIFGSRISDNEFSFVINPKSLSKRRIKKLKSLLVEEFGATLEKVICTSTSSFYNDLSVDNTSSSILVKLVDF